MWSSLDLPSEDDRIQIESGPAHWFALALSLGDRALPERRTAMFLAPDYSSDSPQSIVVVPVVVTCLREVEATDEERRAFPGGDVGKFYFEGIAGNNRAIEPGARVAGCYSTGFKTGWMWRADR
jgi:hypothetical protein